MQERGRQWAEVCFVPNKIGHSKNGPAYRYLATREELKQVELPGVRRAMKSGHAAEGSAVQGVRDRDEYGLGWAGTYPMAL
jgi:hypothetical protein